MRRDSAPEIETQILPTTPLGKPGLRVISVHVSPPFVDLNRPLPGPPLDSDHGVRYASHIEANNTLGFCGSMTTSTAPARLLRNRIFCHVLPPSLVRN